MACTICIKEYQYQRIWSIFSYEDKVTFPFDKSHRFQVKKRFVGLCYNSLNVMVRNNLLSLDNVNYAILNYRRSRIPGLCSC